MDTLLQDLSSAKKIHEYFNGLKRYTYDENNRNMFATLPQNGIYVIFEKGETAYGMDRIVFAGTHDGANNLAKRLQEHYVRENKDRSNFRKYIGLAIINKENINPWLLAPWFRNFTNRARRMEAIYTPEYLAIKPTYEAKVSKYIRENTSFAVLSMDNSTKPERRNLTSHIIDVLSQERTEIPPSEKWLGHYSPRREIRTSGLWNLDEVNIH